MILSYGLSDTGCVRQSNQDRILLDADLGLFLLADGMGGHGHGEIAAQLAIESAHHFLKLSHETLDVTWPYGFDVRRTLGENRLSTAFQLSNHLVWSRTGEVPQYVGMGTTLTGVVVNHGRLSVGNVGDSRVYLLRDGRLEQLTIDDTWVGNLMRNGSLTEEQAKTHSMRHVLTQAIGSARPVEVATGDRELQPGDRLLLTSDGVHGVIGHFRLTDLASGPDLEEAARAIIAEARELGAPDNASCILVRYAEAD